MTDPNKAVMLYSSSNGMTFNAITNIEICNSCGKRTLICPHRYTKESIVELPSSTTHLKCVHVEPDMRLTMSSERNSRMTRVLDNTKFSVLEVVTSLEDIWQEIGIKEDQKELRSNTVFEHIQDLLKEMMADEEDLKSKMKLSIEEYKNELSELCKDLGLPQKQVPSHTTLLQMETKLRNDVDTLNKEKHDRLKSLKRLRLDEQALCDRLVISQHELNFVGCPSLDQLRELEQNVKFLKAEKIKRFELFKKLQFSVKQLWTDLDAEPVTPLEISMCAVNADEHFILSKSNLDVITALQDRLENEHSELVQQIGDLKKKVQSLWERLETPKNEQKKFFEKTHSNTPKVAKLFLKEVERLEELKRQHMQKFIESIRSELVKLWDQCYFGEEQRQLFIPFYSDVFTDETLTEHEHQVATVNSYYEENKEMFKLVEKRETLWKKKLDFENRSTDSNRLNNRGGALLKEEKIRKAVEKELPKVESEIKKKLSAWEKENETYFMFKGCRYIDFLDQQKDEYEEDQKLKKEEKARAKQEEISQESQFGAKSSKRKLVGTPSKSKMARMNATQTPTRFVHSSILPSPRFGKGSENRKPKSTPLRALKNKVNKVKNEARRKSLKRRSIRLANAKRALKDRNVNQIASDLDLHQEDAMRVVSGSALVTPNSDMSLISYNDFTSAVAEGPFSRSSFVSKPEDRTPNMFNYTTSSSVSMSSANRSGSNRTRSNKTLTERMPKMKI